MRIGKPTAIFLSVVFFFIVASIIALCIGNFFPSFSFSDNWIIRIVFLVICFIIARKFYDFIYTDVEVKEGKHEVAVYSDGDKKRKIAIGVVIAILIIAIVFIAASVFYFSVSNDNDVSAIKNFNNSDISFNYSSNWSIESDNSTDITLLDGNGYYLYISVDKTDGFTLDGLYNFYKSIWDDDENITIINSSNIKVNNIPAIATYLKISSNEHVNISEDISSIASFFNIKSNGTRYINSYQVIMVKDSKYYFITYYYTGNAVDEDEFKIFINSFKIS